MIIDFHTHAFPDKLAARAVGSLSDASGGLPPCTDGTVEGLRASMKAGGVDISVVANIATNPRQMHAVNDFAASINSADLIAFGSVHPDAPDALEEVERIAEMGLRGVKLHPEYQDFFVDDPRMEPIYRKIGERGLITLFHAGGDLGFPGPYRCTPQRLSRALAWMCAPVVAAHWGGMFMGEAVLEYLCGKEVWFDISFGQGVIPPSLARRIVEAHGEDRLLFGTDTPWHSPGQELRLLDALELSDEQREKILSGNARKLLKI